MVIPVLVGSEIWLRSSWAKAEMRVAMACAMATQLAVGVGDDVVMEGVEFDAACLEAIE